MRLRFVEGAGTVEGKLYYVERESSFAFEAPAGEGSSPKHATETISLGTLEIEVSPETRRLLYVSGYCPREHWHPGRLRPPLARHVGLAIDSTVALDTMATTTLAGVAGWPVTFDDTTGWVRVSRATGPDEEAAEIASDVIVGTTEGTLTSLWLKPAFVENYPR